ncbi:MAG TPA: hypothetical protein VKA68_13045 [bacterium]|nr:hypothetical protein [bacterium]
MDKHLASIFALCLLTGFFTNVSAADQAEADSLPPSRYALQFQLDQNFSISSFEGSVFSLRQFRTDAPDRRLALSVSGNIGKVAQKTVTSVPTDSTTTKDDVTTNQVTIRLTGQKIHSLLRRGPVTAYTAFGWTVPLGYSFQPAATHSSTPDTTMLQNAVKHTAWNLGVGGQLNFGVEVAHNGWLYWFVEYGIRAEFALSHSKDIRTLPNPLYERTTTSNDYGVTVSPVSLTLGLAVMF